MNCAGIEFFHLALGHPRRLAGGRVGCSCVVHRYLDVDDVCHDS